MELTERLRAALDADNGPFAEAHRKILDEYERAEAEYQKDPFETSVAGYREGMDTAVTALAEAYGVEA
jgi:hypothetical protein